MVADVEKSYGKEKKYYEELMDQTRLGDDEIN
jgi:hypothetical protein